MEDKEFEVVLGWGKRGKGTYKFPATELGMRFQRLYLRSSRRGGGLPSAYLFPWEEEPLG